MSLGEQVLAGTAATLLPPGGACHPSLQLCHRTDSALMKSDVYTQSGGELKYAIGLTRFHSKKTEYIMQEIWSRMTLYNFCEIITCAVVVEKTREESTHIK